MATESKRLFSGIDQAKVSVRSDYFTPGRYIARINNIKTGQTNAKVDFFCVEMTVLHVLQDENGQSSKAGSECSHMMMANHLSFLGNVKAFVSSVLECSPNEVTDEICATLCGPDQSLTGTLIQLHCKTIKTRKGTDFTLHTYQGVVKASFLKTVIDPKICAMFYPDDALDQRIAREAAIDAQA